MSAGAPGLRQADGAVTSDGRCGSHKEKWPGALRAGPQIRV